MGNIWVREFTGGLDANRLPETSPGGSLVRLRDAHINKGGEIEQRADFVKVHALPAGETKGLAATADSLHVFGHQASPPSLPEGVSYQSLTHAGGEALKRLQAWELFKGKIQAIGEFEDGSFFLFNDGVLNTDSNAPPNLADSANPKVLLTSVSKLFVASGPNLFFTAVGDSTDFGDGTGVGEGFIVMSTHAHGAEELTGLGQYDNLTAVFGEQVIMTWYFDPDDTLSKRAQTLYNTGSLAHRAVTQFGDGDVFYLSKSGVRSLRARDSSDSAATMDVGSSIDPIITEKLGSLTADEASRAIGLIEPRNGRYWLIIKDRIYVFSYFRSAKVSAWSEYLPGFDVDDAVVWDGKVWLRSGDDIYVYGGTGASYTYSESVKAEAWLPYLDADQPAKSKTLRGVDAAVRGTWAVRMALDPTNEDASDLIARIADTTFGHSAVKANGETTHFSVRMTSEAPPSPTQPAVLSSVLIHFDRDDQEDN